MKALATWLYDVYELGVTARVRHWRLRLHVLRWLVLGGQPRIVIDERTLWVTAPTISGDSCIKLRDVIRMAEVVRKLRRRP